MIRLYERDNPGLEPLNARNPDPKGEEQSPGSGHPKRNVIEANAKDNAVDARAYVPPSTRPSVGIVIKPKSPRPRDLPEDESLDARVYISPFSPFRGGPGSGYVFRPRSPPTRDTPEDEFLEARSGTGKGVGPNPGGRSTAPDPPNGRNPFRGKPPVSKREAIAPRDDSDVQLLKVREVDPMSQTRPPYRTLYRADDGRKPQSRLPGLPKTKGSPNLKWSSRDSGDVRRDLSESLDQAEMDQRDDSDVQLLNARTARPKSQKRPPGRDNVRNRKGQKLTQRDDSDVQLLQARTELPKMEKRPPRPDKPRGRKGQKVTPRDDSDVQFLNARKENPFSHTSRPRAMYRAGNGRLPSGGRPGLPKLQRRDVSESLYEDALDQRDDPEIQLLDARNPVGPARPPRPLYRPSRTHYIVRVRHRTGPNAGRVRYYRVHSLHPVLLSHHPGGHRRDVPELLYEEAMDQRDVFDGELNARVVDPTKHFRRPASLNRGKGGGRDQRDHSPALKVTGPPNSGGNPKRDVIEANAEPNALDARASRSNWFKMGPNTGPYGPPLGPAGLTQRDDTNADSLDERAEELSTRASNEGST